MPPTLSECFIPTHNCQVPVRTHRQAFVYLHAWILKSSRIQAVTGNTFFRTITEEVPDYVVRDMTYIGARAKAWQFRHAPKLPSMGADRADGVQMLRTQHLPSDAAGWLGCIAKVLTSWNGLMLAAFAEAARALDRAEPCYGPITAKLLTLVETVAEHLTSKASCME